MNHFAEGLNDSAQIHSTEYARIHRFKENYYANHLRLLTKPKQIILFGLLSNRCIGLLILVYTYHLNEKYFNRVIISFNS